MCRILTHKWMADTWSLSTIRFQVQHTFGSAAVNQQTAECGRRGYDNLQVRNIFPYFLEDSKRLFLFLVQTLVSVVAFSSHSPDDKICYSFSCFLYILVAVHCDVELRDSMKRFIIFFLFNFFFLSLTTFLLFCFSLNANFSIFFLFNALINFFFQGLEFYAHSISSLTEYEFSWLHFFSHWFFALVSLFLFHIHCHHTRERGIISFCTTNDNFSFFYFLLRFLSFFHFVSTEEKGIEDDVRSHPKTKKSSKVAATRRTTDATANNIFSFFLFFYFNFNWRSRLHLEFVWFLLRCVFACLCEVKKSSDYF